MRVRLLHMIERTRVLAPQFMFVGGGSVGHIAPGLAVWRAIQQLFPEAKAHFVCSERPEEAQFLDEESVSYTALPRSFRSPVHIVRAVLRSWRLLKRCQPHAVLCTGGALSIPISFLAKCRGIPVILFDADAAPGRANTLMRRWANSICLGFPLRSQSSKDDVRTGYPVRAEVLTGQRDIGLSITGFAGKRPVLLVLGGSQGSAALNQAVHDNLPILLESFDIVHLTGAGKGFDDVHDPRYWQRPFAYLELPHLYAISTVALSRAGAGAIAELCSWGIPTILVPLREVAHDHQQKNAELVSKTGAALLLAQTDLHQELVPKLRSLLVDTTLYARIRESSRAFAGADAAMKIAQLLLRSSAE